ncbi:SGNH/GDSL hydrolase family protein [Microbacterium sp. SORGH_AS_0888]|uniref:SGNH/GDSL hydrolase family protein n=1 Tax=Microbacterium sp. SORGH_AS_0888 TaxID=3041791 RepID=UPI002785A79E|nr:SGNH/GDSL hydrolase family protein [Microbacterium sp. SORGH_AS_0888]MDQ1128079.1 lysophospholipase L1-like esterase [Microbacterium sp. SORGH_AS_0888]
MPSVRRTAPAWRALAAAGLAAIGLAGLAAAGLRHQAAVARRRIGKPLGEQAPGADRVWRPGLPGEPVDLLVLGDSIAAGLGAERRKDTLGARLAKASARELRRPVRLRIAAVVGAETSDLAAQLDGLPEGYAPRAAVIVVGGNDVTHRIPTAVSAARLTDALIRLRDRGVAVVVGTCPDLGALRPVPQPLRALASRLSRQLAAAQTDAAHATGAEAVPLGRLVGPMFLEEPEEMFSLDRFHPSALGYRRTSEVLLPAVLRALADAQP